MSGFQNNCSDVQWSDPYADALVLDPMAEMFVAGCTIDYVTELGVSKSYQSKCDCIWLYKVFQCRSYYDFARMFDFEEDWSDKNQHSTDLMGEDYTLLDHLTQVEY